MHIEFLFSDTDIVLFLIFLKLLKVIFLVFIQQTFIEHKLSASYCANH